MQNGPVDEWFTAKVDDPGLVHAGFWAASLCFDDIKWGDKTCQESPFLGNIKDERSVNVKTSLLLKLKDASKGAW